jgi:prefoldin subunit 5
MCIICVYFLFNFYSGYFVEKSVSDARTFIDGKLKMISENIEKVGAALTGKRRDLEAVTMILQTKVTAMRNAQQQQLAQSTIEQ